MEKSSRADFSQGSIKATILRLAGPYTLAQIINLLYNIIDRMYLGHLQQGSTDALTGVGVCFPILMMVTAFSNLYSGGGAPLFSMARGRRDEQHAADILGTVFCMLILTGLGLTAVVLLLKRPILYAFGASDATYLYADQYISIYLLGSVFVMLSLGLNSFINAQGAARTGMFTVLIGAVLNLCLDPLFIFVLGMGVRGAAIATVISQLISAVWVLLYLTGSSAVVPLTRQHIRVQPRIVREVVTLGISGFVMAFTNSAVQVVCNATLQQWGGDLYVAVATVMNSVREVAQLPGQSVTQAAQPVISYNYGAKQYHRVRESILFIFFAAVGSSAVIWLVLLAVPQLFIRVFSSSPELLAYGIPAMRVYFFGFFMMSFQFTAQTTFVAVGRAKTAVFFSLFRKAIIVIPLTLWLPHVAGLGVMGVFLAEPISNWLGGLASFCTMMLTVWRDMKAAERES